MSEKVSSLNDPLRYLGGGVEVGIHVDTQEKNGPSGENSIYKGPEVGAYFTMFGE